MVAQRVTTTMVAGLAAMFVLAACTTIDVKQSGSEMFQSPTAMMEALDNVTPNQTRRNELPSLGFSVDFTNPPPGASILQGAGGLKNIFGENYFMGVATSPEKIRATMEEARKYTVITIRMGGSRERKTTYPALVYSQTHTETKAFSAWVMIVLRDDVVFYTARAFSPTEERDAERKFGVKVDHFLLNAIVNATS